MSPTASWSTSSEGQATPRVFAVGDCCRHYNGFLKRHLRIESVQNATDQARCVASTIAGKEEPHFAVPRFWSNQYDLKLQIVGIPSRRDLDVVRGDPASERFSIFSFDADRLTPSTASADPPTTLWSTSHPGQPASDTRPGRRFDVRSKESSLRPTLSWSARNKMPHIIVEYSLDCIEQAVIPRLMSDLHEAAVATGVMRSEDVKIRLVACRDYLVGGKATSFCHLTVRLLAGRQSDQKEHLSNTLRSILVTSLRRLATSASNAVDMDPVAYKKRVLDDR